MTSLNGHKVRIHLRIHHRRRHQGKQDHYSMSNLVSPAGLPSCGRDDKYHHERSRLCNHFWLGKDAGILTDRQRWKSGQFHPPFYSSCPRNQSLCRSSLGILVVSGFALFFALFFISPYILPSNFALALALCFALQTRAKQKPRARAKFEGKIHGEMKKRAK